MSVMRPGALGDRTRGTVVRLDPRLLMALFLLLGAIIAAMAGYAIGEGNAVRGSAASALGRQAFQTAFDQARAAAAAEATPRGRRAGTRAGARAGERAGSRVGARRGAAAVERAQAAIAEAQAAALAQ
jgi:hypothetical protein